MSTRKNHLLSSVKPDTVDDGKGGKVRVLRDEKGEIIRNPARSHEPFKFGELFVSKIDDLIEKGSTTGGGTGSPAGNGAGSFVDLSSAKTQVEADEMIVEHILRNEGIAKTDPQFIDRQQTIRAEM
ncbi:hypothetical protein RZS08_36670, partial [Arthrospira platensis SPKY1]|nr:hypothetical protein [Arthrospira platensis SPKY1]